MTIRTRSSGRISDFATGRSCNERESNARSGAVVSASTGEVSASGIETSGGAERVTPDGGVIADGDGVGSGAFIAKSTSGGDVSGACVAEDGTCGAREMAALYSFSDMSSTSTGGPDAGAKMGSGRAGASARARSPRCIRPETAGPKYINSLPMTYCDCPARTPLATGPPGSVTNPILRKSAAFSRPMTFMTLP